MKTKRRYLHALTLLVSTSLVALPALSKTFVYVSNSIDGNISTYEMESATGALKPMGAVPAAKLVMPMAIAPDKSHLYAVTRSEPMRVFSYSINAQSGQLSEAAQAPLPDSMPNVATDRTGRFLFTASYSGNKAAVSPIDADGRVTRPAQQIIETGKNAHSIQADHSNRFVFISNLGSDQIMQFRFDAATGHLSENVPPVVHTKQGEGPRHFVFSPDNRFVYVLHELTGTVTQYALDADKGTLHALTSVASVPSDSGLIQGSVQPAITATRIAARDNEKARNTIAAADIQLSPDGRFLYTTERTGSKIALFNLDPTTGAPSYALNYPTVLQPRGIKIAPSGRFLIASGEKSESVAVYKIDPDSGKLSEVGRYPGGHGANWVEIVDLP